MALHLESQHDVRHCYLGKAVCPVARASYEARFVPATGKWLGPVPDCLQRREERGCSNEANLLSHFVHLHPQGTVWIGGASPPKCCLCGLQTWAAGTVRHKQTAKCRKLEAQRRRQQLVAEVLAAAERKFTAYQKDTLRSVEIFTTWRRCSASLARCRAR